jgi:hypothetical protein
MNLREITPPYYLWRFGEVATVCTQDLTLQSDCHYAYALIFTARLCTVEGSQIGVALN